MLIRNWTFFHFSIYYEMIVLAKIAKVPGHNDSREREMLFKSVISCVTLNGIHG